MSRIQPKDLRAAQVTVATFARIVGKPLVLRNGQRASTDGIHISAPFESPRFYTEVERALAHILFRSDASARNEFARRVATKLQSSAVARGLAGIDFRELEPTIARIVDILEGRRTRSLWAILYEGSAEQMRREYADETATLVARAHDTLFNLFCCVDAGHDVPPGPLDPYRPLLEEALRKVERRGYAATLITTRWLVSKVVAEVLRRSPAYAGDGSGTERLRALREAGALFVDVEPALEARYNDYRSPNRAVSEESKNLVSKALELDLGDAAAVDAALDALGAEALSESVEIRNRLQRPITREQWRDSELGSKVTYADAPETARSVLDPKSSLEARRLRARLSRIARQAAYRLDDCGVEVDTAAWIERRTSGVAVPCFRQSSRKSGFSALVLIDRSVSMTLGSRTSQAERACSILSEALQLPSVDLRIWGFQSPVPGETRIVRFPLRGGFDRDWFPVDGDTPTHVALALATRELRSRMGEKLLVQVTDGGPLYYGLDKSGEPKEVPQNVLLRAVRERVREARRCGISVITLIFGHRLRDGSFGFDVTPKEADFMYGSRDTWRYVDEDRLGGDLVETVTDALANYLRG